MKKSCCIDTNVLLNGYDFSDYDIIYCPIKVLEELDNMKGSENPKKAYSARRAMRALKNELLYKIEYVVTFDDTDDEISFPKELDIKRPDNNILYYVNKIQKHSCADAQLLSYDINMIEKAKALGISCRYICDIEDVKIYKGYKEIELTDKEMALFYENLHYNNFDCVENEYLLINDSKGNTVDKFKWDGSVFKPIKLKPINNQYTGKVRPRNKYQELAMDLLQDEGITIKVLSGKWGSGKNLCLT